jgi:CBS-domain-containing membrane protein
MVTATDSLLSLTAADVMSREPLTIPRHMSLHRAAHLLTQAQVSGAPVVDDKGHCLGVLSTTDLVRWLDRSGPDRPRASVSDVDFLEPWQMAEPNAPTAEVGQYMTTDIVVAWPETGIGELARRMLDAHVHRLIIVDATGRVIGLVSTTDLLGALARHALRESCRP